MATEEFTVNLSLDNHTLLKGVLDDALRNVNGVFSLDAKEVDRPRTKLAIWMIRIAFWIGGFGEIEFGITGEVDD